MTAKEAPNEELNGWALMTAKEAPKEELSTSYVVEGVATQPPINVDMEIAGKTVTLELDTGASVTLMSEKFFWQLYPSLHLQKSKVALKTYSGEKLHVVGQSPVQVKYQQQAPLTLTLIVIKGDGPTLLGRDWLQYFQLDWSSIKTVKYKLSTELNSILTKFEDVFFDGLGTIKEFKAKLSVSSTAKPRFHRPRHVPFAVKLSVEEELCRLE